MEYIGYKDPIGNGQYNMGLTDEEVVRCRDCEFMTCDIFKTLDMTDYAVCKCSNFCDGDGSPTDVQADGYCAWAVRRDD